ncbi:hypothetical protein GF359_10660, partial [candidate division WOR-3 bacterium]|nr:hypothetical protein [candidate division WOR-3 bacterium]MBD3365662.1 hypothetical protein [candidate division WOR-3 bacterium]
MMFLILTILVSGIDLGEVKWESLLNANHIYDIEPLENGAWCATNGGLHFFSIDDSAFTESYTNIEGLPHNTCRSLELLPNGYLWAGTDRGLALYDPSKDEIIPYSSIEDTVFSLDFASDTLAVGTGNGVFLIDINGTPAEFGDDILCLPVDLADKPGRVVSWFAGDLWIGSETGLIRYTPDTDEASVLLNSSVRDINCQDSVDVLIPDGVERYRGTEAGFEGLFDIPDTSIHLTSLAHSADTVYVTFTGGSGLYQRLLRWIESDETLDSLGFWVDVPNGKDPHWSRYLQVIECDEWGRVWIGSGNNQYQGDGLIVWDVSQGYEGFEVGGLSSNISRLVFLDDNENLWVTHFIQSHTGVSRYTPEGSWENYYYSIEYSDDTVGFDASSFVVDSDSRGRVVFGSWWAKHAVFRFDPLTEGWEEYHWGEGSDRNILSWLAVDPYDRIWAAHFGTNELISVVSADLSGVEAEIPWPYGDVYSMKFDSDGNVWFASRAGLIVLHSEDLQDSPGLGEIDYEISDRTVWDIELDGSGGLWGATSQGVFHLDQEGIDWYDTENNNQIPENDFRAVDRDPWGGFYFLTRNKGLVVYDPAGTAYDTSTALWQRVSAENSPLISGFPYTWLDTDRTGRLAIGTEGGGVSLLTFPQSSDSAGRQISVYPNPCYT